MEKTLVTVTSFTESAQARLAKDRLASVGILAQLKGETGAESPPDPIKLEVSEEDLERAREILARPAEATPDEDEEPPEIDPESAEGLATRAWRAAFLGMAIVPVLMQIYSLWLVLKFVPRDEEVSRAGMRKVYGALAIDGTVLLAVALLFRALSRA
jgi:hypothetical protein